jgi:hypothetical protein
MDEEAPELTAHDDDLDSYFCLTAECDSIFLGPFAALPERHRGQVIIAGLGT